MQIRKTREETPWAKVLPNRSKWGEETQKTDENTKRAQKSKSKSNDAQQLVEFMMENYETKVKPVNSFDDFYHAIYELIEMFCQKRGQLQYKIPRKEELSSLYKTHHKSKDGLTDKEFEAIAKGIFKLESFTFGKAAVDVLGVLFGVPACALLAKRFVPGIRSLSDDIVIPAATSGAVVYLAKTNKL
ncbi:hypothetical protein ACP4OV_027121 [Aristida adscensionis]